MLLLDVNICIYAWRRESPHHEECKRWLDRTIAGPETVGVPEQVLAGMARIVTNHRIYREPSTPSAVLAFCEALLSAPAAIRVRPGERHWGIFTGLVSSHGLRGNDIADAYLAALALESGATWVTTDRGFARFQGLRLLEPLKGSLKG